MVSGGMNGFRFTKWQSRTGLISSGSITASLMRNRHIFLLLVSPLIKSDLFGSQCFSAVLHPYYKLHYIEIAWGGAEEQAAEVRVGNLDAKNWKEEALQIFETTVCFKPFLSI